jgi:hypothetical protein
MPPSTMPPRLRRRQVAAQTGYRRQERFGVRGYRVQLRMRLGGG